MKHEVKIKIFCNNDRCSARFSCRRWREGLSMDPWKIYTRFENPSTRGGKCNVFIRIEQ